MFILDFYRSGFSLMELTTVRLLYTKAVAAWMIRENINKSQQSTYSCWWLPRYNARTKLSLTGDKPVFLFHFIYFPSLPPYLLLVFQLSLPRQFESPCLDFAPPCFRSVMPSPP